MITILAFVILWLWAVGCFVSVGLIACREDRQPRELKYEVLATVTWPISVPLLLILACVTGGFRGRSH